MEIQDDSAREMHIDFIWTNSEGKEIVTPVSVSKMGAKTAKEFESKRIKFRLGNLKYF